MSFQVTYQIIFQSNIFVTITISIWFLPHVSFDDLPDYVDVEKIFHYGGID